MYSREEIKNLINTIKKFRGEFIFNYVKEKYLYDIEELYHLYYGRGDTVTIGRDYYSINQNIKRIVENPKIYDENSPIYHTPEIDIEGAIDELETIFKDNISYFITDALYNLNFQAEELKYFDSHKKSYNKFKKEVLRLKEGKWKNKNT